MRRMLLLPVILILMLAACDAINPQETETPTTEPTADEGSPEALQDTATSTPAPPTRTPFVAPTLPPTWTPRPAGALDDTPLPSDTPTPFQTRTLPSGASPLPPTWTPVPTSILRPGESENRGGRATATPLTPSPTPAPVEAVCYLFTPDKSLNKPSEFIYQGSGATIYWNPIPQENYEYEVKLYHPDGTVVLNQIVQGQEFTFTPDILVTAGFEYGWEVIPLYFGEPVCFPITGEIYINPVGE